MDRLRTCMKWRSRHEASQHLAPLLGISINSAFERLSGNTRLSYEEVVLIGDRYQVYPFDFGKNGIGETSVYGTMSFTGEVAKEVRACRDERHRLRYAATEIPVFYTLGYPVLSAVKTHVWLNFREARKTRRMPPLVLEDYEKSGRLDEFRAIHEAYIAIEREEIWGSSMLDNPLSQIRYLLQMRALRSDGELFARLRTEIETLITDLDDMVRRQEVSLRVYANYFHYASNFILREGVHERYSYIPAKNFGFYKYTGQGLYDNYLDDWNTQLSFLSDLSDLDARSYNAFFRELQLRADRELDLMIS